MTDKFQNFPPTLPPKVKNMGTFVVKHLENMIGIWYDVGLDYKHKSFWKFRYVEY